MTRSPGFLIAGRDPAILLWRREKDSRLKPAHDGKVGSAMYPNFVIAGRDPAILSAADPDQARRSTARTGEESSFSNFRGSAISS